MKKNGNALTTEKSLVKTKTEAKLKNIKNKIQKHTTKLLKLI